MLSFFTNVLSIEMYRDGIFFLRSFFFIVGAHENAEISVSPAHNNAKFKFLDLMPLQREMWNVVAGSQYNHLMRFNWSVLRCSALRAIASHKFVNSFLLWPISIVALLLFNKPRPKPKPHWYQFQKRHINRQTIAMYVCVSESYQQKWIKTSEKTSQ